MQNIVFAVFSKQACCNTQINKGKPVILAKLAANTPGRNHIVAIVYNPFLAGTQKNVNYISLTKAFLGSDNAAQKLLHYNRYINFGNLAAGTNVTAAVLV